MIFLISTAAILLKICTISPLVDLTFDALWMSAFSNNQANSDSIGCLIAETALENKSSAALPICLSTSGTPRGYLTGDNNSEPH